MLCEFGYRLQTLLKYQLCVTIIIKISLCIIIITNNIFFVSSSHSTDCYVEVLDGSRVHPETYEWARKMAVDALEYDDTAEDANPAGALEEILESPDRLRDLDLDAFAEELERQVRTDNSWYLTIIYNYTIKHMFHHFVF